MKKGFYLRKEYTRFRNILDGSLYDDPRLVFSWAKIASNKYVVILPKIFVKEPGDKIAIVNHKKFLKLMDQCNLECR